MHWEYPLIHASAGTRTLTIRFLCSLLSTLLICLSSNNAVLAQPAQVIIIRHAEKPDQGNELSLAGRERAAALAPDFLGNPELLKFGHPVAIYAQLPNQNDPSLRPIQTVTPLVDSLGLKLNENYGRDDYAAMVKEIMQNKSYKGHMVLICWEHHVIPKIAAEFGAANVPDKWPGGDVFDRLWILTANENNSTWNFVDLPQRLMFKDSKQ